MTTLAARLRGAGLATLGDVARRIDERGARWHVGLAGIGANKALRVGAWLVEHVAEFAARVGDRALVPIGRLRADLVANRVLARTPGIAPYEAFHAPAHLTGAQGVNRDRAAGGLPALDDAHAVSIWLRSRLPVDVWAQPRLRERHPTYRAYRREIERLWAWATLERGKALADLLDEDAAAYALFLADPQPRATWVSTPRPRWHPDWRPFNGPLSVASQRYAMTVVKALFAWLTAQRYLIRDPWGTVPRERRRPPRRPSSRALTVAEWAAVRVHVARLPPTLASARLRAALALMNGCGLRIEEAAGVKCGDFATIELDDGIAWELRVVGKGEKERIVPVTAAVLAQVGALLARRGMPADPRLAPRVLPLLPAYAARVGPVNVAWSKAAIYDALKAAFAASAGFCEEASAEARLPRASPHWLRHTFATTLVHQRTPLPVVQGLMGHASVETTAAYSRGTEDAAHAAVREAGAALGLLDV